MTDKLTLPKTDTTQRLAEAIEDANKLQRSPVRPLWQGALIGIGSTVGLGIALYIFSIILQPFTNLPVLGDIIRSVQPNVNQTIDTTPAPTDTPVAETPTPETPSPTNTDSQSTIKNNYFSLQLPGTWSLKINQSSSDTSLLSVRAEADSGAVFTATVNEQSPNVDYPSTTTEQNLTIDGRSATGHEYSTNATTKVLDAQLAYKGEHYSFSLSFDPAVLNGQTVFDEIIASISLQS